MEFLALIIVLGGIGAVIYGVVSKNDSKKPLAAARQAARLNSGDPDPLAGDDGQFWALKPGDLVKQLAGADFLVRRSISLNEGGYGWNEHLLDDAQGERKWLSVEDDEGLDLGWWEPVPAGEIQNGEPGDKTIELRGRQFVLDESGSANYSTLTATGQPTFGEVEYFQYEAADKSMLAYQRYDAGKWEASFGVHVSSSDFEIYPSTDPSERDK